MAAPAKTMATLEALLAGEVAIEDCDPDELAAAIAKTEACVARLRTVSMLHPANVRRCQASTSELLPQLLMIPTNSKIPNHSPKFLHEFAYQRGVSVRMAPGHVEYKCCVLSDVNILLTWHDGKPEGQREGRSVVMRLTGCGKKAFVLLRRAGTTDTRTVSWRTDNQQRKNVRIARVRYWAKAAFDVDIKSEDTDFMTLLCCVRGDLTSDKVRALLETHPCTEWHRAPRKPNEPDSP